VAELFAKMREHQGSWRIIRRLSLQVAVRLESTYQACLAYELRSRGIDVQCEAELPVRYKGLEIEAGYRVDILVGGCIIVENKSVQELAPIHEAQLLTYLKLSERRLGFLVNWNVPLIRDGIHRMVNKL
jgi:GxxExxY protein